MVTQPRHVKSPSEIADEAREVGSDAVLAARGYAQEAGQLGREATRSIRPALDDAKATTQEAADTVRGIAGDAKSIVGDAMQTGRAYARTAVETAGNAVEQVKVRVRQKGDACVQFVKDEPVKASLLAVGAGAILAAVLGSALRGGRRRLRD